MNYQKIYTAFIADRRAKELHPLLTYVEKHHILPRAKGGGDEPENLIYLTPEDHFFAHLLLAKIYRGKMWLAVVMMKASHARCYGQSRRLHGALARQAQKDKAPDRETKARMLATQQRKAARYTFEHNSGARFTGTGLEFRLHSGLLQCDVSKLVTGNLLRSKGWFLAENAHIPKGGYDREIRAFIHRDGREFRGTQFEFRGEYALEAANVSAMVRGRRKTVAGWRYAG